MTLRFPSPFRILRLRVESTMRKIEVALPLSNASLSVLKRAEFMAPS